MIDVLYQDLLDKGFNDAQINQLEKIDEYYSVTLLTKYIKSDIEVDLLRKFSKLVRDENWVSEKGVHYVNPNMKKVIDLMCLNLNFEYITDKGLSDAKIEAISFLLQSNMENVELMKNVINCIKMTNITDVMINDIIWDDLNNGIDPSSYLKETYTSEQIYLASSAMQMRYYDVLKIVDLMEDDGCDDVDLIHFSLENKIDIVTISNTQNKYLVSDIIDAKVHGYDVEKFLDKKSTRWDLELVRRLMEKNYTNEQINNFLKTTKLNLYRVEKSTLDFYIKLVEMNIDIQKLLEYGGLKVDYLESFLNMSKKIPKEYVDKIAGLENILPKCSLDTITIAFDNNRLDLIPIIINLSDVSELGISTIGEIIKNDTKNNTHHKIVNLLYDKGADIFNDYKPSYEFNSSQQLCLALASFNYGLSDEQIEPLRDNNIQSKKMEILTGMMAEGLDVSIPLKYINKISIEQLKAMEQCIIMGFKLDDKELEQIRD